MHLYNICNKCIYTNGKSCGCVYKAKSKENCAIQDFQVRVGLKILPQKSPPTKLKRPSLPSEGKNLHLLRGDKYEV